MRAKREGAKFRTVKLYAGDAEELFRLAREKGVTIAEAYRALEVARRVGEAGSP